MLLLRHGVPHGDAGKSTGARREQQSRNERVLVCVRCDLHIAWRRDAWPVDGALEHTRVNPGGVIFRFCTFKRARNVAAVGEPELDFTWFEGCAWQILQCARCALHLGWRFEGAMRFVALLTDRVQERG